MNFRLDEDAGVRELLDAVTMLEPPPLAPDTIARIVARRASGERVVLATANARPHGSAQLRRSIAATIAAIAAIAIAGVALEMRRDSAATDVRSQNLMAISSADSACANFSSTRDSSLLRHIMISAFGVSAACGAEPMPHGPIAYVPTQILPGTFTYQGLSITDDAFTSVHAPTSLTITRTTWKGVPALLAVRAGSLVTGVHLDSLVVSASGPTALYFASWYTTQHPPGSIHAAFDSSSVTIVMKGQLDSASTFPYRMKVGELPFGFSIPLLAPALPLARDWHGVIDIAPPIHPRAASLFLKPWESLALRVVRRETLRVAAGTFDCWKVQVGEPEDRSFIWVDAVSHLVVRSQTTHRFGDTSFEDRDDLQSAEFVSQ